MQNEFSYAEYLYRVSPFMAIATLGAVARFVNSKRPKGGTLVLCGVLFGELIIAMFVCIVVHSFLVQTGIHRSVIAGITGLTGYFSREALPLLRDILFSRIRSIFNIKNEKSK